MRAFNETTNVHRTSLGSNKGRVVRWDSANSSPQDLPVKRGTASSIHRQLQDQTRQADQVAAEQQTNELNFKIRALQSAVAAAEERAAGVDELRRELKTATAAGAALEAKLNGERDELQRMRRRLAAVEQTNKQMADGVRDRDEMTAAITTAFGAAELTIGDLSDEDSSVTTGSGGWRQLMKQAEARLQAGEAKEKRMVRTSQLHLARISTLETELGEAREASAMLAAQASEACKVLELRLDEAEDAGQAAHDSQRKQLREAVGRVAQLEARCSEAETAHELTKKKLQQSEAKCAAAAQQCAAEVGLLTDQLSASKLQLDETLRRHEDEMAVVKQAADASASQANAMAADAAAARTFANVAVAAAASGAKQKLQQQMKELTERLAAAELTASDTQVQLNELELERAAVVAELDTLQEQVAADSHLRVQLADELADAKAEVSSLRLLVSARNQAIVELSDRFTVSEQQREALRMREHSAPLALGVEEVERWRVLETDVDDLEGRLAVSQLVASDLAHSLGECKSAAATPQRAVSSPQLWSTLYCSVGDNIMDEAANAPSPSPKLQRIRLGGVPDSARYHKSEQAKSEKRKLIAQTEAAIQANITANRAAAIASTTEASANAAKLSELDSELLVMQARLSGTQRPDTCTSDSCVIC